MVRLADIQWMFNHYRGWDMATLSRDGFKVYRMNDLHSEHRDRRLTPYVIVYQNDHVGMIQTPFMDALEFVCVLHQMLTERGIVDAAS